jgi:hypothetical protein
VRGDVFLDYYRQHGIEIKILRIFNTYGPRMLPFDGRVVSNFIVQALRDEDITIYGGRLADEVLLLCGRYGGRYHSYDEHSRGLYGLREHGQPGRGLHTGAGKKK